MSRVKSSFSKKTFHKKILKANKGFVGAHSRLFRVASQERIKSLSYSYFGRKQRKRNIKSLWIRQINILGKLYDSNYHEIVSSLKKKIILLNKKNLAKLSVHDPNVFSFLIKC